MKILQSGKGTKRSKFHKGKVAGIEQDSDSDDVIVIAEDILNGEKIRQK